MMTKTGTNIAVMLALGLLAPIHANAFGLGKLELSSALNEPFKAEIAITALKGDDADNLQVRLASSKEFEQAGIERNFLLTQFKFEVVEKAGKAKIVISSEQAIREPFIDFLLMATTGSGRLIREYTVLLDPPINIFKKPVKSLENTSTITSTKNSFQTSNIDVSTKESSSSSVSSYGPTNRQDTLWNIALKTRPEKNITVHQMMIALLESNPSAFQYDNVNGLKAGYTLAVPSKDSIYKRSKQQAINAIREQNILWKNRNARPAIIDELNDKIVTTSRDVPSDTVSDTTAKNFDSSPNVEDGAHLKLVAPNDKSPLNEDALSPLGTEKIKALSEQLTLAQETIEGQAQETIDFKARMDTMEQQMDTMRRLISLKDADLARLQRMLDQEKQPENSPSDDADEVSSVEKWEALIGTGSPAENTVDEMTSDVEPTEIIEPKIAVTDTNDETVLNSTALVVPMDDNNSALESRLQQVITTSKNFVSKNKIEMLIAAGGLLLLLIGSLVFKRRKETEPSYSFDNTQTVDETEDKTSASIQAENINEEKLAHASNITESEVELASETVSADKTVEELLEQADMLVAYTDYEQAMTMLEQAKEQEPANQTVLIKMLFVLFKKQQKEQFVSLANKLTVDKDSAEWVQVAQWGKELVPMNTLFDLSAAESEQMDDLSIDNSVSITDNDSDKDLILNQSQSEPEEQASDTIEFNLDDYRSETLAIADKLTVEPDDNTTIDDESLTFDTSFSLDIDNQVDDDLSSDNTVLSLNDQPLSLDLNEDVLETEAKALLADNEDTFETIHDLNIDLDTVSDDDNFGFDINAYDEIDEAETKLDLASAYSDMGDPDGARSILEEVLNEGNDEQKVKAQTLLDNLS